MIAQLRRSRISEARSKHAHTARPMATPIRQRSPFDEQPSSLSVATASCCCCCCCCLAVTTAAITYSAKAPYNEARRNGAEPGPAAVIGALALPVGLILAIILLENGLVVGYPVGGLATTAIFGYAGVLAGSSWGRFAGRALILIGLWVVGVGIEVAIVLLLIFGLGPFGVILWLAGTIGAGVIASKAVGSVRPQSPAPWAGGPQPYEPSSPGFGSPPPMTPTPPPPGSTSPGESPHFRPPSPPIQPPPIQPPPVSPPPIAPVAPPLIEPPSSDIE